MKGIGLHLLIHVFIIARGYDLTFGSPKDDTLSLFHLGERAYDHLLILPPKSKGKCNQPNRYTQDRKNRTNLKLINYEQDSAVPSPPKTS